MAKIKKGGGGISSMPTIKNVQGDFIYGRVATEGVLQMLSNRVKTANIDGQHVKITDDTYIEGQRVITIKVGL